MAGERATGPEVGEPKTSARWRGYVFLVLTVVHALILLALLELGAQALLAARDAWMPAALDEQVRSAYPGSGDAAIRQLLDETWQRPWRYEPWVGFREAPRRGDFVNISENGGRFGKLMHERDPFEPADGLLDLFVFGGSTTFGYGVHDAETFPARLESYLEQVRVFNFGRGYYYSAQELALFQDLLRRGARPDVAIFVDGLNEGQPAPFYSAEMSRLFAAYNESPTRLTALGLGAVWQRSALRRLSASVLRRLGIAPSTADSALLEGEHATPGEVRDAYLAARRQIEAVARAHGVTVFFFIQPVPGYRNELAHHPWMRHENSPATAARMRLLDETVDGITSFSLAGLLDGFVGQAFVDSFHYSPAVNDLLAQEIARHLRASLAQRPSAATTEAQPVQIQERPANDG